MKSKKINRIWIVAIALLGLAILTLGVVFSGPEARNQTGVKQLNNSSLKNTTLTGVVMKTVCQGAQPNYPKPEPCIKSVASNANISLYRENQLISQTKTDNNGRYNFQLNAGVYALRVQNESSSYGHNVEVKAGNNELNIDASFHTP